jgi:hypothetical protein
MNHHYPNTAWLSISRDVFDRLSEFKRKHGLLTWEQVFELLLDQSARSESEGDLSHRSPAAAGDSVTNER